MLRIYSDQKTSFSAAAKAESEARVFGLMREHFGGTAVWRSDEAARSTVAASLDKAAAHGMRRERDAFKLAALMMVFGPDFDRTEAWAAELVAHTDGGAPELLADMLYARGIDRMSPIDDADDEEEADDEAQTEDDTGRE